MRQALETDFFSPGRPRVIAHRGASAEFPENTQLAFQAAVQTGAAYIELDVRQTRDGEVVVIHDENLQRITSLDAPVAATTFGEISRLDAGFNFSIDGKQFPFRGQGVRIPRLSEVLQAFPNQGFVIEFKPTSGSIAAATLQVVKRAAMTRQVLFASEHFAPIAGIRELAPQIPTNLPAAEIGAFVQSLPPGAPAYHPTGDALQIPPEYQGWRLASRESIACAHTAGLEVHVWTVNTEDEMRQMLALGVDGIITDYPARLLDLLRYT